MNEIFPKERRRYRRYIVQGQVRFRINSSEASGELVNFSQGGLLVRSQAVLPPGTQATFRVTASCYPNAFDVAGEVVGVKDALLAIKFLEQPKSVHQLLEWLERENVPWTGTFGSEDPAT